MENPGYYAVLPATVRYDKRLKANEKLLYAELTSLAKKDGYAWPSNGYLANLYEVSRETVSRWLSRLQDFGYIKISIDQALGNERRIIILEVMKDQEVLTKKSWGFDKKIKTPIDENVKQNNTSINNINKYTYASIDFETFWKAYPKKKAKQDALKAFQKLHPDGSLLKTILSALDQQKRSEDWNKEKGRFIPYPATWLNGHRWEDDAGVQASERRWDYLD